MLEKTHQHHIEKVLHIKSALGKLYLHLVIQALASSMISIFVPLYLLGMGYELENVFLFLLVQWVVFSVGAPIAGLLVEKIGLKEMILIRTPLFVASLIALSLLGTFSVVSSNILYIAAALGFSSIIYTISISSLFSQYINIKKKHKQTSRYLSLPRLGSVFGPLIGGLIAYYFNFQVLFVFVSIIMMSSVIPIWFIKDRVNHPSFSLIEYLGNFFKHRRLLFFMNMYGIRGFIFYLVIPIAIYYNTHNIVHLGMVISLIGIINIMFTLKFGMFLDRFHKNRFMKIGSLATALFFIALAVVYDNPYLLYVSLIAGIIEVLTELPFEAEIYKLAKASRSQMSFLAFKEASFVFGRVMLFTLLIIASNSFDVSFLFGSFASILFIFF